MAISLKLLRLATLLVAVCILSFLLVYHSPVDPVAAYIGADMLLVSQEQRQQITEYWGLNQSGPQQFLRWAGSLLQGDFGTSMIYRKSVVEVIGEKFMASLALMGVAWVLSGIIGFLLGIWAAYKRDSFIDRIIKWYCYTLASTPTFWMGLLLLMVFAVWLQWFPVGMGAPAGKLVADVTFMDRLKHLILPALTLSIVGIAPVALHTRQKLIDVLSSEYVLFAKARGESGFGLIRRHGLRNVAIPALTLQFASFSELFGGAVLAETVFSYPGLGQASVHAGLRGDVPLLLGIVICSTLFVFAGNLLADLSYRVLDPRIRKGDSMQ